MRQTSTFFLQRCSHAILYFHVLQQVARHSTTCQRYADSFAVVFDTIDYKILINPLENKYGISRLALAWLKSYLPERPQRVIVNGTYSNPKCYSFSIPQGSVLVFIALQSTGRCDKSSRHRYDDVCWWLPALCHNKTEQSSCFLRSAWTLHWWCSTLEHSERT